VRQCASRWNNNASRVKLAVIAIGRLKAGDPHAVLIADYEARINGMARQVGLRGMEIEGLDVARKRKGLSAATADEDQLLLTRTAPPDHVVMLDERGDDLSSKALADMIGGQRDLGTARMTFLIGGADGHGPGARDRADRAIAFGRATWPHLLVRVMLVEQLYRAVTVLAGHPYHRV